MPERAFDCPHTGMPCTTDACTVMHCETQAERARTRTIPMPPRRYPPLAEGWVQYNNAGRPEGDYGDIMFFTGRTHNERRLREYNWEWVGTDGGDISAYRPITFQTTVAVPGGDWQVHTGRYRPTGLDALELVEVATRGGVTRNGLVHEYDWDNVGSSSRIVRFRRRRVVIPEGWTQWQGGPPPVSPMATVHFMSRAGQRYENITEPQYHNWVWRQSSIDIIAYFVVNPDRTQPPEGFTKWEKGYPPVEVIQARRVEGYRLSGTRHPICDGEFAATNWMWSRGNTNPVVGYRVIDGPEPQLPPEHIPATGAAHVDLDKLLAAEMPQGMAEWLGHALVGQKLAEFDEWLGRHREVMAMLESD